MQQMTQVEDARLTSWVRNASTIKAHVMDCAHHAGDPRYINAILVFITQASIITLVKQNVLAIQDSLMTQRNAHFQTCSNALITVAHAQARNLGSAPNVRTMHTETSSDGVNAATIGTTMAYAQLTQAHVILDVMDVQRVALDTALLVKIVLTTLQLR